MRRSIHITKPDLGWLTLAVALIVLQLWWLPGNGGNTADSYSASVEGVRGYFETLSVLSEEGLLPPIRRELSELIPHTPGVLLLLAPDRLPDQREQEQLRKWVQQGGVLVFAPNWGFSSASQELEFPFLHFDLVPDWTDSVFPAGPGAAPPIGSSGGAKGDSPEDTTTADETPTGDETSEAESSLPSQPPVSTLPGPVGPGGRISSQHEKRATVDERLLSGALPWHSEAVVHCRLRHATTLVTDEDGGAQMASWQVGRGTILVCATPTPFSNRSMLFPRQAEFAVRVAEHAAAQLPSGHPPEIIMSEYLNTAGAYTGASVMISPLLRTGTLQLILVAVLLAWAGFHRFGPPLPEQTHSRRSLAESATAVGNLHFTSGDGGTSVRHYLDWLTAEVRHRFGHTSILQNTSHLARQTGLPEEQLANTLQNALERSRQTPVSPTDAAATIRRLADIRQRLLGRDPAEQSENN